MVDPFVPSGRRSLRAKLSSLKYFQLLLQLFDLVMNARVHSVLFHNMAFNATVKVTNGLTLFFNFIVNALVNFVLLHNMSLNATVKVAHDLLNILCHKSVPFNQVTKLYPVGTGSWPVSSIMPSDSPNNITETNAKDR